jgi:NTE family protein
MRIGVTLSGGFVKGVAHIGFLKALEYKGLVPSFVCGSSAGAVIGALYCAGYSPDKILEIAKNTSWKKLASPSLKGGLFKLDGLRRELTKLIGEIDLRELRIPFGLVVVNLKTLKAEFKREGSAPDLITASCSIPPLFAPWEVGGKYYVDGGIRNCLPAEMAKAEGVELNICSNANTDLKEFSPKSLINASLRASLAGVIENQERRLHYCDIIVNHQPAENPFDFEAVEEIVESAYRETLKTLEENRLWL